MNDILKSIDFESLPGFRRGKYPALYFRDEIAWSPDRIHFALAYTITEASFGNDVGTVALGTHNPPDRPLVNPLRGLSACCWRSPWCKWIDEQVFVFKAYYFDGRELQIPLVAIHLRRGFSIIPDTNDAKTWHNDHTEKPVQFLPYSQHSFRDYFSRNK